MSTIEIPEDNINVISFVTNGNGLKRDEVEAVVNKEFNRLSHSEHEENIETVWKKRLEGSDLIYNAIKFRYHSNGVNEETNKLKLNLGLTSYRSFVGTNMTGDPDQVSFLKNESKKIFGHEHAYFASPLGVGSLLQTNDDKIILMKRSNICAEGKGLIDRPGGHAEPKVLLDKYNFEDHVKLYEMNSSDVLEEIFESSRKEIRDEINIPIEFISDPLLLGITQDLKLAYRPSAEFLSRCSLSSDEILERYKEGNQAEKFESTELVIMSLKELFEIKKEKKDLWSQLSPGVRGQLVLMEQVTKIQANE